MNTRILLDHEPVADGGFFARAVLRIEGSPPDPDFAPNEPGRVPRSIEAVNRISARNVRVIVRPGADAEFIQMRHTFESVGDGNVLTIHVGDVYCLDQIRIRMEALVGHGSGAGADEEADVVCVVVTSELQTADGPTVETVELPIRMSRLHGGRVSPAVSRTPSAARPLLGG